MNQYDPNQVPPGQQPSQTPYPPYQQQQPQGYQQPYQQPIIPTLSRNPLQVLGDRLGVSVGVIVAAGFLLVMCLVCGCVAFLVFLAGGRVPPPTPPPTLPPTVPSVFLTLTPPIFPGVTLTPTFNSSTIGTAVNPYVTARLDLAQAVYIDVLNSATNQFERKAQLFPGSAEFDTAMTAFNVGNVVAAPDIACIDRVRIEIPRSDGVTIRIGVCLKDWGVIRSADIAELGGGDLGLYPLFTDVLSPYLTAEYRNMLD